MLVSNTHRLQTILLTKFRLGLGILGNSNSIYHHHLLRLLHRPRLNGPPPNNSRPTRTKIRLPRLLHRRNRPNPHQLRPQPSTNGRLGHPLRLLPANHRNNHHLRLLLRRTLHDRPTPPANPRSAIPSPLGTRLHLSRLGVPRDMDLLPVPLPDAHPQTLAALDDRRPYTRGSPRHRLRSLDKHAHQTNRRRKNNVHRNDSLPTRRPSPRMGPRAPNILGTNIPLHPHNARRHEPVIPSGHDPAVQRHAPRTPGKGSESSEHGGQLQYCVWAGICRDD